jgi:predicted O-linked N-acetylglucosamine transferase (SPINDLY family)
MSEIWDRARERDPANRAIEKARTRVVRLREADREINALQRELSANPQNADAVSNLLRLYTETGQSEQAKVLLEESGKVFGDSPEFLKFAVDFCSNNGQWQAGLLALARFEFVNRDTNAFLERARQAIQFGGLQAKIALANDPVYAVVRSTPEFRQLIEQ